MKTEKSIRQQLEQQAQQVLFLKAPTSKNHNKYKRLKMNWKELIMSSLLLLFTCLYHANAAAQVDFDQIQSGMLMSFDNQTGEYHSLLLQDSQFEVDIYGLLATVTVKQRYLNQNQDWLNEAVYAFPLADSSAVYRLRMTIGERVIEGEIHEKKQAEAIYQQAKSEGRTATMVKQYRPNIFTSDIANIAPLEQITVEISYQQSVRYDNGYFQLQLPMAIKPRFIPDTTSIAGLPNNKVLDSGQRQINVNLQAGFEVDEIRSLNHQVAINQQFGQHQIKLSDQQLYDGKDFVLRWYPQADNKPTAALFSEQKDGFEYALLMVLPPKTVAKQNIKRNITFIIDSSGSMEGQAIKQAKDALLYALEQLDSQQQFNIIDFDSNATALFEQPAAATPENIAKALDFIDGFSADGGTNMAPALAIAMNPKNISDDRLNQIIFLTDGSVGNEAGIFEQIANNIGTARLFTIAIGEAPNNYFMNKAAMFGRGNYTQIADLQQVDETMKHLFDKLETPALTDIELVWNAKQAEQSPKIIPDLYLDQPIIITAKTPLGQKMSGKQLTISGLQDQQAWDKSLSFKTDGQSQGIARLWARQRIEGLMDDMMLGGDRQQLQQQITELALQHQLVSAFTALVAVDKTPNLTRMAQAKAAQQLPYPQTALGWKTQLLFGLIILLLSQFIFRLAKKS